MESNPEKALAREFLLNPTPGEIYYHKDNDTKGYPVAWCEFQDVKSDRGL